MLHNGRLLDALSSSQTIISIAISISSIPRRVGRDRGYGQLYHMTSEALLAPHDLDLAHTGQSVISEKHSISGKDVASARGLLCPNR